MDVVSETTRREILRRHLPLQRSGVEIGAFDKPCVSKVESDVLYADILDTDGMREKARKDGRVVDAVLPVDIVIGEDLLASVGGRRFSYIVASHVIEHIPNPLLWLQHIHAMLENDGVLSLAMPEHRFCFDRLREETRMSQWIGAWLSRQTRPSAGQVFDQVSQVVTFQSAVIWNSTVSADQVVHSGTPHEALSIARRVSEFEEYRDIHCSVFTVASFLQLIRQAIVLDLFHFELVELTPTIGFEFFATFRKPARFDWAEALAGLPIPREGRYASLPADFDCRAYLSINADIMNARLDPVEHYIDYGRKEGRRYRH